MTRVRPLALLLAVGVLLGMLGWYGAADPNANPEYDTERWDEPADWEFAYMYVVSLLAVVWVGWRTHSQWRVDPERLALVPRRRDEQGTGEGSPERTGNDSV